MKSLIIKINMFDAIRTLLSLYERVDDEMLYGMRENLSENRYDQIVPVAMQRSSFLQKVVIRDVIVLVLQFASDKKSELRGIPEIETLLTTAKDLTDPVVIAWLNDFDENEYEIHWIDVSLLDGTYQAKRYFKIKKYEQESGREQIHLALDLVLKTNRLFVLKSIISHNIKAELTTDNKIKYPNLTPESILSQEEIHPRKLAGTFSPFPLWKSNMDEIAKKTLASIELGKYSPIHRKLHDEEHLTYFDQFMIFPEFDRQFKNKFHIPVAVYRDVSLAIKNVALSSKTSVVYIPGSKLVTKLAKISRCSRKEVEKVLEIFTLKLGDNILEKPIFFESPYYLYSYSSVSIPIFSLLHECYDEMIDNDLKGKEFEKECRLIFKQSSLFVFEKRLIINKKILPDGVSIRLFRRLKNKTDLDVIGVKDNILFLLECKTHKKRQKRQNTQVHKFETFYEELIYKAKWISENFEEFSQIASEQGCLLPTNCRFIIPLLVSDFWSPQESDIAVFSTVELMDLINHISSPQQPFFNFLLQSNTEVTLRSFEIA